MLRLGSYSQKRAEIDIKYITEAGVGASDGFARGVSAEQGCTHLAGNRSCLHLLTLKLGV